MSSILDLVTGGSLLPHVYCRKVTLERSASDASLVDLTLLLEIYQDKNALASSSWLNDLSTQGTSFLDSMFVQVLELTHYENVQKLLPSYQPLENPGNLYVAKQRLGDGYLPRGVKIGGTSDSNSDLPGVSDTTEVVKGINNGLLFSPESNVIPAPFQVSNSSLLGNISGKQGLKAYSDQGKVREEVINGKAYYAIPFEHKIKDFNPSGTSFDGEYTGTTGQNLGFAFYTFLNIPYWISNLEIAGSTIDPSLYQNMFEKLIIEGPVNSEVVFVNGALQKTREAFFLPSGLSWEGSVHLHASGINPSPNGYSGDGATGDEFRGWMAGEKHTGPTQPKLKLLEVPNNKLVDFRHGLFAEPLDQVLGLGTETEVFDLNPEVATIVDQFISPFQKEKKKDFIKDNDSEFSKLYISRDKDNKARALFFIDMIQLLNNNSNLFPLLFDKSASGADGLLNFLLINPGDKLSILEKSKILQLKVYRDRVKKRVIGTRYENYSNDESYEEPSKLIGTISDENSYKTPNQGGALSEIDGIINDSVDFSTNFATRHFMFTDSDVSSMSAGTYRYRLEFEFKDGTYEFLYELSRQLSNIKMLLDEYYDLSTSYFATYGNLNFNRNMISEDYVKASFKKYFDNGVFVPEFFEKVEELTTETPTKPAPWPVKPWNAAPLILKKVQRIFGLFPKSEGSKSGVDFDDDSIKNMLSPVSGTPHGIEFFSRLLRTSINKIDSLLGATKVNKTGSEIAASSVPNGYNFNTQADVVVSPGDFTIREDYSFDHPNELFHATSNNNIYMDYLSIGNAMPSSFMGMRSVKTQYFINRCRLEAVKFSPLPKFIDRFNGTGAGIFSGDIGLASAPAGTEGPKFINNPDSFSRTGYSYLAPSIVRLSDPIQNMEAYNFLYSAFKDTATSYLDNPNTETNSLFSYNFTSWVSYDRLFISLFNYKNNKKENPDADLMDSFTSAPEDNVFEMAMQAREPYKRTMEEMGITLHDPALHKNFFEKESGAVSVKQATKQRKKHLKPQEYSDGLINAESFFKAFIFNRSQSVIGLKGNSPTPESYNINLPTSFKLYHVNQTHKSVFDREILHPEIAPAFTEGTATSKKYNNFLFFNMNLTSKIEVFRGTEGNNAKNDASAWSLLSEADLNLEDNQKLFCRIVLYNRSLAKNIELPILDKYFLIYNNASDNIPPLVPLPPLQETTNAIVSFWENQAKQNLQQKKLVSGDALKSPKNVNLAASQPATPKLISGAPSTSQLQAAGTPAASSPATSSPSTAQPVSTTSVGGSPGGGSGPGY